MISAVTPKGRLRFSTFTGSMNAKVFLDFVRRLLHDEPDPVFLILDGHPVHRSKAVREFVEATDGRLRLFFLPPYSPELNPDEWVWKNVKHDRVGKHQRHRTRRLQEPRSSARLRRLQKPPAHRPCLLRRPRPSATSPRDVSEVH